MVERKSDSSPGRVGAIVSQKSPSVFVVDWDDGPLANVKIGLLFTRTIFGSARFLQITDPQSLTTLFSEKPLRVFLMGLFEMHSPSTAVKLRDNVASCGLPIADVAKAWKSVQRAFEAEPHVAKSASTYRWSGEDFDFPEYVITTSERPADTFKVSDEPSVGAPVALEVKSSAGASLPVPKSTSTTAARSTGDSGSLLHFANGAELDEAVLKTQLRTPLAIAAALQKARLGPWHATDQVAASTADRRLFPFIASSHGQLAIMESNEFQSWLVASTGLELLRSAADEFRTIISAKRTEYQGAFVALAKRVAAAASSKSSTRSWIDALEALKNDQSDTAATVQGIVVSALANAIRASSAGPESWSAKDLMDVGSAVANMPFHNSGGRSALVSSVARTSPEVLKASIWWRGFDFKAAAEVGDGDLSFALGLPEVAQNTLRFVIDEVVRATDSRRKLGLLFSSSTTVVEHIAAPDMVAAFRRSASIDPSTRRWLEALSNSERLDSLSSELLQAQEEAVNSRRAGEELGSEVSSLTQANENLRQELHSASTSTEGLRDRERRQLQIGSIRALAQLALLVESEADRLDAAALVARTRSFAVRQGLIPVGMIGETVDFDPSIHESPGSRPKPGETVNVVRPGYEWTLDNERLVLEKAQVSVITDNTMHG